MSLIAAQTPSISGEHPQCPSSKWRLSLLTRKNPAKLGENGRRPIAILWWWTDEMIYHPLVVKWRVWRFPTSFSGGIRLFHGGSRTKPCRQIKGISIWGFEEKMKIAPEFQMGTLSFSGYFDLLVKTPNTNSLYLAAGHRLFFISRMSIMLL